MKHPLLENKGYLPYITAWAIVMMVHAFLLYFYYSIPTFPALLDSVVHNLLYAGIGLALWYVVRYAPLHQSKLLSIIVNHLSSCLITVAIWIFSSRSILRTALPGEEDYLLFLEESMGGRVLAGVLIYSVIILIYYLAIYYKDLQYKRESELRLRSMIKESELTMLKSQINPHFVFNSLNSISALTLSAPKKAHEMVIKLSDFLRYSVGPASNKMVELDKELDYLNLYLEIEKTRFGEKLEVIQNIDKGALTTMVPTMILQPLLENAIKYGVHENLNPQPIQLECEDGDRQIRIQIRNFFEADAIARKGEGIGLKNIKSRLKLTFGSDDLLQVSSSSSEFTAELTIPKNNQEND